MLVNDKKLVLILDQPVSAKYLPDDAVPFRRILRQELLALLR